MLFRNTNEFKGYIAFTSGSDFKPISTYVRAAEYDFIIPLIGEDQFEDLEILYNVAYDAALLINPENPENEVQALMDANDPADYALLDQIRRAEAQYTAYLYVPKGAVTLGTNGISVSVTEDRKPASEAKIANLRISTLTMAFAAAENLLAFLDKAQTLGDYALYGASEEYDRQKRLFVNSAKEFTRYFNINNSRYTFFKISAIMDRVESKDIQATIGADFYTELKTQLKTETVTPANQKVIDLIKPAVANRTIAKAITELSLNIGPLGITVIQQPPVKELPNAKGPTPAAYMDKLERKAELEGKSDLDTVKGFLDANVDDYPTYKDSSAYVAPEDAPCPIINEGDGGFVA